MTHFFTNNGLPLLFAVVLTESCGIPVPAGAGWNQYSDRVLPRAESLMARHGGKTVFFGRFVSILRYTVAWVAGLSRMSWWRFLFWNAAGGIAWATAVGLLSYYGGQAAASAFQSYGLYGGAGIVFAVIVGWFGVRYLHRRAESRL